MLNVANIHFLVDPCTLKRDADQKVVLSVTEFQASHKKVIQRAHVVGIEISFGSFSKSKLLAPFIVLTFSVNGDFESYGCIA